MSTWDDKVNKHIIHNAINKMLSIESVEILELTLDHKESRDRIIKVSKLLDRFLSKMDPDLSILNSGSSFNNFNHSHLQQLNSWVEGYKSSKSRSHLDPINDYIDAFFLPAIYNSAGLVKKFSTSLDKEAIASSKKYHEFLSKEKNKVDNELKETKKLISDQKALIDLQSTELTNLKNQISNLYAEWNTKLSNREQEMKTIFDETKKTSVENWNMWLNDIKPEFERTTKEIKEGFKTEIDRKVQDADFKHNEIINIYDLVFEDSVKGGYMQRAKNQRSLFWAFLTLGVISALLTCWWLSYLLKDFESILTITNNITDGNNTETIITGIKLSKMFIASSITLIMISLSTYFIGLSNKHSIDSNKAKWRALDVASSDPFIKTLNDEKIEQELKSELFRNWFIEKKPEIQNNQDLVKFMEFLPENLEKIQKLLNRDKGDK